MDLGGLPRRLKQRVTDWLWSTAFYTAALIALAGVVGLIWPFRRLHRKSRLRALIMLVAGAAIAIGLTHDHAVARRPRQNATASTSSRRSFISASITTIVAAPPERVFAAIKAVTADEIALFNLFTSIRRFGRPGPESILNAPGQQPILDVAVRTGFHAARRSGATRSGDRRGGGRAAAHRPAARRAQRRRFTSEDFKALAQPGFAKATMNFRVADLGNGTSRVDTETRVFATDDAALAALHAVLADHLSGQLDSAGHMAPGDQDAGPKGQLRRCADVARLAAGCGMLLCASPAAAHPAPFSYLDLHLDAAA